MDSNWDPMRDAYKCPKFNHHGLQNAPTRQPQSSEENLCLFVTGFPSNVDRYGIKNFFSQAGRINHVKIYPDQRLKNHIVAYVNVATYKDALDVISEFNNFSFGGSTIRVGFAAPLKPAADTLMQSNYGPGHLALGNSSQLRPSFAGLAQIMSDVERLNTTPDHRKVEILEFRRLQPSSEVIDRLIQQPVCDWAVPVKAEQRNNAAEKAGTENNNDCDSGLLPGTGATEQPSGNLN